MPSQSDLSGDADAMTGASEALAALGENSALWLVHRLDRVAGGLMVFARNKQTAAHLSELVGGNGMLKEYLAVVAGSADGGALADYIYKDSARGKAFIASGERKSAKKALLEYTKIAEAEAVCGVYSLVRIKLHTGRFHQIRVQFASRQMPLVGDGKYGSRDNRARMPALHSCRLAFDGVDIVEMPDTEIYPWSLFKEILK